MATMLMKPDLLLHSDDTSWDRARWEKLGDDGKRYEVIDGVLYMSTAPRLQHQLISRLAERALYGQIDDRGLGITLHAPIGLFMPGCDPVQPDLVVILAENQDILRDAGIEGVPDLLVEILSPSTRTYDLVTKRAAYARAGVPEYWVLRPQERDIVVHTAPDPGSGQYGAVATLAPDVELASPTLPFRAPVAAFSPAVSPT